MVLLTMRMHGLMWCT